MLPIISEWPQNVHEAVAIQERLRGEVSLVNENPSPQLILGVDVGYDLNTQMSYAIGVLMPIATLEPMAVVRAELPTSFPYVPGLLSFREVPVLLVLLSKLPYQPDLIMVDGQGIAHPRRLGIASHLGVITGFPTIGVAKSRLTGSYEDPGPEPGERTPLMHRDERIGTVLRTKRRCLPLFISPGHKVDHAMSIEVVWRCLRGYRLPEPTRLADKFSKRGERELLLA